MPITAVAFLLTWLLPEVRLRTTTQATDAGHTFAMPAARSSQEEIERALHLLASRDSRSLIYRRLADRVGIALDPLCCWLLFRLGNSSLSRQNFPAASFIHPSQHNYLTKKKWYIYFLWDEQETRVIFSKRAVCLNMSLIATSACTLSFVVRN